MSQDFLPLFQPYIRLAQANAMLMTSSHLTASFKDPSQMNPMAISGMWVQGLMKNYAQFWAEMQHGASGLFASGRAGLMTAASEL
jgi:hypothetical protein